MRILVRRGLIVAMAVALGATLAPPAGALRLPLLARRAAALPCDPIDPAHCLLPFPNDFFTVADAGTDTGRRVNLNRATMPRNTAGKPIDTTELNRNDGFSPGSAILTRVPGIDLHQTWGTAALANNERDHIADIARYTAPDAPIVVLNTVTGERHPFWSELDTHPATTDDKRLLLIRPARNLDEATRYVVALRAPKRADGSVIAAGAAFAAYRDGTDLDLPLLSRRPSMERIFSDLAAAGVARDDLYLAWDFTVASERSLTERALAVRDKGFALLGDTDLGDGVIAGTSPAFTIGTVTEFTPAESRGTARRVEGTIEVPNFLTPQHEPQLVEVPDPADQAVWVRAPGSRLNYGPDGLPTRSLVQPTLAIPFTCNLPHTAFNGTPAHPYLYGHGLLGDRSEANGGSTEDLRLRGFAPCAVNWMGMSEDDLVNVATILADISNFPSMPDRVQQGYLNFLYLGRAMAHPDGLGAHTAFRNGAAPLLAANELFYDGNSQGAIMGGALTALAPDFTRAVLGVPGMNYSTLLNRSSDWEGQFLPDDPANPEIPAYGEIMYAFYPDKLEQQLIFDFMQMMWDRAETNGYAHHMTADPLAGTPAHQVMLQVAFADHQVANVSAEVEARTMGAQMKAPALAPGQHWSVDPLFGFEPAAYNTPGGSYLVYWYSPENGNLTPPNGNLPPRDGRDPHEDPRRDNAGSDQKRHFLLTGELIDVCAGGPCVTTAASRANT